MVYNRDVIFQGGLIPSEEMTRWERGIYPKGGRARREMDGSGVGGRTNEEAGRPRTNHQPV